MQTDHNSNGGWDARPSRRRFLQTAAAGVAATLPAVVEAGAGEIPQLPLSDEQQLEARIAELKAILQRMHPLAEDFTGGYLISRCGSGTVVVGANAPSCRWQGPGLYEVHKSGSVRVYHLNRHYSEAESRWQLWGAVELDGRLVAPRVLVDERDLRRKLEGGAK